MSDLSLNLPEKMPEKQPALRVMPMPADVNQHGDVFGGWIMSQVDIAGATAAMRRARGRVVTVAVNSFVFKNPVSVGDVVSFFAEVIEVGRTSVKVMVEVFAERNPAQPEIVRVCSQSSQPNESAREMDESQEGFGEFVVTCRDASELLDPAEETLDEVAVFVDMAIETSRIASVGTRWNDRLAALGRDGLDEGVRIVALVGKIN